MEDTVVTSIIKKNALNIECSGDAEHYEWMGLLHKPTYWCQRRRTLTSPTDALINGCGNSVVLGAKVWTVNNCCGCRLRQG